jgi:hypothetical protein
VGNHIPDIDLPVIHHFKSSLNAIHLSSYKLDRDFAASCIINAECPSVKFRNSDNYQTTSWFQNIYGLIDSFLPSATLENNVETERLLLFYCFCNIDFQRIACPCCFFFNGNCQSSILSII